MRRNNELNIKIYSSAVLFFDSSISIFEICMISVSFFSSIEYFVFSVLSCNIDGDLLPLGKVLRLFLMCCNAMTSPNINLRLDKSKDAVKPSFFFVFIFNNDDSFCIRLPSFILYVRLLAFVFCAAMVLPIFINPYKYVL